MARMDRGRVHLRVSGSGHGGLPAHTLVRRRHLAGHVHHCLCGSFRSGSDRYGRVVRSHVEVRF